MSLNDLNRAAEAKLLWLKKRAWDDFYVFAKYVCGRELMEEQPHREVCEFLTAGLGDAPHLNLGCNPQLSVDYVKNECQKILKKLLMLPRGTFKSTIASNAFPIWLFWHNQDLRIMIDSETLGNAKLYLAGIKDMIENNKLLRMICVNEDGEYLLEPNKKIAGGFTEEQLILTHRKKLGLKEPSVFCSGVDNARTGMHPDVIIMDDLVSERNVSTDVQLSKTKDHYRYSLSLLEPGGLHIIIGTRYHMADLYGELIEWGTFDKLIRPAVDNRGQLYFPSRLGFTALESLKREQGSYIFSCQYMLNPIDDSAAIFKKAHIKYYSEPPELVAKYITVDLAISEKETADYTVVMCTGIDKDKNLYVLEYDRGHYKPQDTIAAIFRMFDKHKDLCKAVGVEVVAFQKALMYFIKDEMKRTGIYMPLKELKADKDKFRRVQALQPLFENDQVFIKIHHTDLEQELLEFPLSKHDDIIDSLAYILQLLRPGNVVTQKLKYVFKPSNRFVNY
jgi:predicted phage terminase large subunit-like protein